MEATATATTARVFISHTGQENRPRDLAAAVSEALKQQEIDFFYDCWSIPAGVPWEDFICRAAGNCKIFVVILSFGYFQRYWCMRELDLAFSNGRPLLPVYFCISRKEAEEALQSKEAFVEAFEEDNRVTSDELERWWHNAVNLLPKVQGIQVSSTEKDAFVKVIHKIVQHVRLSCPATDSPERLPMSRARTNPVFEPFWDMLDSDLQDALVLAGTAARREGKDYISTSQFFSALHRQSPNPLPDFFQRLPNGALPPSTASDVVPQEIALEEIRSLSPCMTDAVSHLLEDERRPQHVQQVSHLNGEATNTAKITQLSAADVFVDIAMHGRGKSTMLLRSKGVGQGKIQSILNELKWHVRVRSSPQPPKMARVAVGPTNNGSVLHEHSSKLDGQDEYRQTGKRKPSQG